MPVYLIKNRKLVALKEKSFDLEKDLQSLTEENLEEVFGLEFASSEFNIQNFWIDTLAFDPETKAFVIIEYKKDQSFSVVDQGFAYLASMLNNKADFILEYNEKKNVKLERRSVDWSQSRVIFIAKNFTPHQRAAISFKDLPIELWEVQVFENNLVLYNQLKAPEARDSIKTISKSPTITSVSQEVKTYTLEDHLKKGNKKIKDLFLELREKILEIDEIIEEKPVKFYVGYKAKPYNFVSVHIQTSALMIDIRAKKIDDSQKVFHKLPEAWKYGKTPIWRGYIDKPSEIPYILNQIKQAYQETL